MSKFNKGKNEKKRNFFNADENTSESDSDFDENLKDFNEK